MPGFKQGVPATKMQHGAAMSETESRERAESAGAIAAKIHAFVKRGKGDQVQDLIEDSIQAAFEAGVQATRERIAINLRTRAQNPFLPGDMLGYLTKLADAIERGEL